MIDVLGWVAGGELVPRIHAVYPLDHIADAIAALDRREAAGKVVVRV